MDSSRGGSRKQGVDRPDLAKGPWPELVALLYDRLYVPAGMPSFDTIGARSRLKNSPISRDMAYAVLKGTRRPSWSTFKALVLALDGDPKEWEQRFTQARRRHEAELRSGKLRPLPGVDEDDEVVSPAGVGDWDARRLPPRRIRRLRRVMTGLPLAAAVAVFVMLSPSRWWVLAPPAGLAIAAFIWLNLRRRRLAGNRRGRQRQIMLEIFRAHCEDLLRFYRQGTHVEPRFARLELRLGSGDSRRHRRVRAAARTARSTAYADGTTVAELFEEAAQNLVLISDAGIGKTTQLALLAEHLINKALQGAGDGKVVMPLLVNLCTYQGEPFEDWLVSEVRKTYQINPELTRRLLAGTSPRSADDPLTDDVLLLLDGLDEIPEQKHRLECAEHIQAYRQRCAGLVVTCRDRDIRLASKLGAVRYVMIDKPDRADVQRYLTSNDTALAAVRAALEADTSLWELLRSPLMLDVVSRTYADQDKADELSQPGLAPAERRSRIFDAYIRRMLREHRGYHPSRYQDHGKTLHWLCWLARTLTERSEQVFYLDRLLESWMPSPRAKLPMVLPRYTMQVLAVGLTYAWLASLTAFGAVHVDLRGAAWVLAGLLTMTAVQAPSKSPISYAVLIPVIFTVAASYLAPGINWTTTAVALVGAAYVWAMIVQFEGSLHTSVMPIEQMRWSWRISTILPPMSYLRRAYIGSSLGIAIGGLEGGLFGYSMNLVFPQAVGLITIAILMLWAISTFGRNFEPSLQENRPRPNEGIRRSARFSLIFGGFNALAVILVLDILISLGVKTASAIQIWLTIGFIGAMYGISRGIRFGGAACIYHWTLRVILARRSYTEPFSSWL
jgi:hypothetical protein